MKHLIHSTTIFLALICSVQFAQALSTESLNEADILTIDEEKPNLCEFENEQDMYNFINYHYQYFSPVAEGSNEHDVLFAAVEHLDTIYQFTTKQLEKDPHNPLFMFLETVKYAYFWSINQFCQFADHSKIDAACFEDIHNRRQQLFLKEIDDAFTADPREHRSSNSPNYQSLLLAVNTISHEIVKKEIESTPELIAKMIKAFDLVIDQISSTNELYALHTYICMLKLNGDIDKACKYIEKGIAIDNLHCDFVALAASDEYHNYLKKQNEQNEAALEARVKELRTKYLSESAATTNTIHNTRSAQRVNAPKSSNGKWVAMSEKMYQKTYGVSYFDQLGITAKQVKEALEEYYGQKNTPVTIFVYQGDLVTDMFDVANFNDQTITEEVLNPEKIKLGYNPLNNMRFVSIQGSLVSNRQINFPRYLYVKDNLYCNVLELDSQNNVNIAGNCYVDEILFFYNYALSNFRTQNIECALAIQNDFGYENEEQLPIIELYGCELDAPVEVTNTESSEYYNVTYTNWHFKHYAKRKLCYELLRAGLISPKTVLKLEVRYHDAYIKYLNPKPALLLLEDFDAE